MATPLARGYAYSGSAKNRLSYAAVKKLAQAYGLPGDAIAQIAKGESGLYADVQQRDPGDSMVGYGLLQMTPNAWGQGTAAQKRLAQLGGIEAMSDPAKNMAMARFLYKAAGNKLTPWYGTRFLTNRSGEGTLGPVNRDLIPSSLLDDDNSDGNEPSGNSYRTTTTTTPGVNNSAARAQLVLNFLGRKNSDPVDFALQARELQDVAPTSETTRVRIPGAAPEPSSAAPASSTGGSGAFKIDGPNPGRLQKPLTSFAKKVADTYGGTLTGLDGSSHSKFTTTGNVSQHYTGNATDVFTIGGKRKGDPGWQSALIAAGRAALIAAGMPRSEAMKKGIGLYNVNGHQIIFGTNSRALGGDHTDHLHISAK